MDELLTAMDRTAANLVKLQDVWNRAARFVPTGPSRGSHPEYDNLRRAWNDLLAGLPPIDGWTITDELPDIDALGQDFIDYFEISEAPFPLHEAGQKPGKDLAEYQFRLNRARSRAARERLDQFTVPQAARRYRTPSFVDADLLTPAERDAQQAFAEMENRHAEERQRLQADLDRARQDANPSATDCSTAQATTWSVPSRQSSAQPDSTSWISMPNSAERPQPTSSLPSETTAGSSR